MSRTLIIRPEAEAEMAEAHDWYEERVSGLGAEFLLSADTCFNSILRNPYTYPQVYKSARRALLRRFPYQVLFVEERECDHYLRTGGTACYKSEGLISTPERPRPAVAPQ